MNYPTMQADRAAKAEGTPIAADGKATGQMYYPSLDKKPAPVQHTPGQLEYPSMAKQADQNATSARKTAQDSGKASEGASTSETEDATESAQLAQETNQGEVLTPDMWSDAVDQGRYDELGKSVTAEMRSLGASDAELATSQNLVSLCSERRHDPAWQKWAKDMLLWVRSLRAMSGK
jgi:Mrp family chromosome partitioning ATPase